MLLLVASAESSLCPLTLARALAEVAEGLQLLGGEDAADAKLGLRAEADERGLRLRQVAGAVFDERFVRLVGVDSFVEGAAGRVQSAREGAQLLIALAANLAQACELIRREVEPHEQVRAVASRPLRPGRILLWFVGARVLNLRAGGRDGEEEKQRKEKPCGDERREGFGARVFSLVRKHNELGWTQ